MSNVSVTDSLNRESHRGKKPPAVMEVSQNVENAAIEIGAWLRNQQYRFITITPASHARVVAQRCDASATNLRDVFGWSLPFKPTLLPPTILEALRRADALEDLPGDRHRSRVRYSTLDGGLFVHSSWPTTQGDAVFFGPDTYRFASYVRASLPQGLKRGARVVEVGCGSGAVGLRLAHWLQALEPQLHLLDINARALSHARVNARLAGLPAVDVRHSDLLQGLDERPDLVICNPPYLPDAAGRAYRDGGAQLGAALSLRLLREAVERLAPGGLLLLYTGTAVVEGAAVFERAFVPLLRELAQARPLDYDYRELDPDVFGEELDEPAMATAERIAAVGLAVQLRRG